MSKKGRMPEGKTIEGEHEGDEGMRACVGEVPHMGNKTDCTSVDSSGGFVCKSLGLAGFW